MGQNSLSLNFSVRLKIDLTDLTKECFPSQTSVYFSFSSHKTNFSWKQISLTSHMSHIVLWKLLKHTVEIRKFYCHSFLANFPSNQRFTTELYNKLIFRQINVLLMIFSVKWFNEKNWQHSVEITEIFSHSFFDKNFVKATVLLKNSTLWFFDFTKFLQNKAT